MFEGYLNGRNTCSMSFKHNSRVLIRNSINIEHTSFHCHVRSTHESLLGKHHIVEGVQQVGKETQSTSRLDEQEKTKYIKIGGTP